MCHVCVGWGVDGACLPEVNGLGVYVDHASRRGSWRWGSSGGQSTMFDLYMHVVIAIKCWLFRRSIYTHTWFDH